MTSVLLLQQLDKKDVLPHTACNAHRMQLWRLQHVLINLKGARNVILITIFFKNYRGIKKRIAD